MYLFIEQNTCEILIFNICNLPNAVYFSFALCRVTQESRESKELKVHRYCLKYFTLSARHYILRHVFFFLNVTLFFF